jgi:hypothetical protein
MTRYILLFDIYGLVFVERPLWREDGSVIYICCWPLPAQSFLGPSPLELETIFYCLRLETSLFVASYDSQGHGGDVQPRLHLASYPQKAEMLAAMISRTTPRHRPHRKQSPYCCDGVFTVSLLGNGHGTDTRKTSYVITTSPAAWRWLLPSNEQ